MNLRYWGGAIASLARHCRDKEFVADVLNAGIRADKRPRATPLTVLKAYPEFRHRVVPLREMKYSRWNMDPLEQYFLAALCDVRQPQTIFEIGTFDGSTTLLLARSAPTARIFTLDLPPENLVDPASPFTVVHEKLGSWGERFQGQPEADRITQLFGDSRAYDFSTYFGKMDLVVVDGGHDADCVTSDTKNALRMVADGGVVVWDDYQVSHPAVVQVVDAAAQRHGFDLVCIAGTGLGVYDAAKGSGVTSASRGRAEARVGGPSSAPSP